jgi:hypothetical protein
MNGTHLTDIMSLFSRFDMALTDVRYDPEQSSIPLSNSSLSDKYTYQPPPPHLLTYFD